MSIDKPSINNPSDWDYFVDYYYKGRKHVKPFNCSKAKWEKFINEMLRQEEERG